MFNNTIYEHSPFWFQEVMISFRAASRKVIRESRRFRKYLYEIENSQWFSEDELKRYQEEKALGILGYAVEHVPYYRSMFADNGWSIGDFQVLEDISKLPFLTKKKLRSNSHILISERATGIKSRIHTSGTTGSPLKLSQSLETVIMEHAFRWRQLHWAGFTERQRQAWIRGDVIVPVTEKVPPFWRLNSVENMLMMSSFHLSEKNAPYYLDKLQEFDPVLIRAFPNSIHFLAKYLENADQKFGGKSLKAIVTSSETLSEEKKLLIEQRMNCQVFDWYGSAERVTAIGTCEHGNYHVLSDYGLCEFVKNEEGMYEIVGTGFLNRTMPLIRYKTEDFVMLHPQAYECPCGRKFMLVDRIVGRDNDYIKTRDGRRITSLGFIVKGISSVAESQIVQNKISEICIYVVPIGDFNADEKKRLFEKAVKYLGNEIDIRIEIVPSIPRTKNGKFKLVVCNI